MAPKFEREAKLLAYVLFSKLLGQISAYLQVIGAYGMRFPFTEKGTCAVFICSKSQFNMLRRIRLRRLQLFIV